MESTFFVALLGLLPVLLVWDGIWRGVALWKAAQHKQIYWFIALLLVNSLGVVPIIYIKFFQKPSKKSH